MGMVLMLHGTRSTADERPGVGVLEGIDSGEYYSATLVLVDRKGNGHRVPITKSSDLVRALLRPDLPGPFLSQLLSQTKS